MNIRAVRLESKSVMRKTGERGTSALWPIKAMWNLLSSLPCFICGSLFAFRRAAFGEEKMHVKE